MQQLPGTCREIVGDGVFEISVLPEVKAIGLFRERRVLP